MLLFDFRIAMRTNVFLLTLMMIATTAVSQADTLDELKSAAPIAGFNMIKITKKRPGEQHIGIPGFARFTTWVNAVINVIPLLIPCGEFFGH